MRQVLPSSVQPVRNFLVICLDRDLGPLNRLRQTDVFPSRHTFILCPPHTQCIQKNLKWLPLTMSISSWITTPIFVPTPFFTTMSMFTFHHPLLDRVQTTFVFGLFVTLHRLYLNAMLLSNPQLYPSRKLYSLEHEHISGKPPHPQKSHKKNIDIQHPFIYTHYQSIVSSTVKDFSQ